LTTGPVTEINAGFWHGIWQGTCIALRNDAQTHYVCLFPGYGPENMGDDFKHYTRNFNRVRMVELIDHHQFKLRTRSFRASLIANPLTGLPYDAAQDGFDAAERNPAA
jgi:hypothetical protein